MKVKRNAFLLPNVDSNVEVYDLVLKGGWVIDPSQSINGRFDVAIRNNKIAAIAAKLPNYRAKQTLAVDNLLVCPGFIDLHTHVYEWVTDFGLCADDVGINAGVTTVVDQGSCGFDTFANFKATVIDKAQTDVRCFPMINQAKVQKGGIDVSSFQSPDQIDIEAFVNLAAKEPEVLRGFKVLGESGTLSHWGIDIFKAARKACDKTNLPLYVHTGELLPVAPTNRLNSNQIIKNILCFMKAGDILAHCYSCQPDGLLGNRTKVPDFLNEAINRGVLLDLGHGQEFSFEIARRMMSQGVLPHIISSDVHGDFDTPHNDSTLDYSLFGAMGKLIALGMDLQTAIASVTIHPASVLKAESEIGTLRINSRADITVIDLVKKNWLCHDSLGEQLIAKQKLVPAWVVRSGKLIKPHCRLLRDLHLPQLASPIGLQTAFDERGSIHATAQ